MGENDGLLADHRLHNSPLGIIKPRRTNNGIRVVFIFTQRKAK